MPWKGVTVSDLSSRFLLGVDAHPAISLEKTFRHFTQLFETYGLPNRIRTENGVRFASNALARLSQLSVCFTPALPGTARQGKCAAQVQVSSWASTPS
jgi:hypothetical protein